MEKTFSKEHTNIAKGFAIILMLIYHLFEKEEVVVEMGVNYAPLSPEVFTMISKFGNVCVSVFVFLTAYGIAASILKQKDITIKEAYGQAFKRFGKLMLNFLILYVSVILVMFPHFNLKGLYGEGWQGGVRMLTDALGLQMFYGEVTLNETWWYMEIAYILIFLVPALTWLVKKIGYYIIPVMYFLPFVITMNFDIERYLLVATVGICAAYGNWIGKGMEWKVPGIVKWLIALGGLVVCVIVRQNHLIQENYLALVDAGIALFFVWSTSVTIGSIPGVRKAFAFLGRHSMNIYFVHTFFYLAIWRAETYQFKYAIVILLFLLAVTLVYSVVLEGVKSLVKWLIGKLRKKPVKAES